ncbi:MAG: GNAT family N-acetyltransferase [Actinomycetota bacterium]|nr:GNAT family N-acetyltransferase [Actinomycetota bacterium]
MDTRADAVAAAVEIGELDPTALSDADAGALAEVANAAEAVDAPFRAPVDAAYVRRGHLYGHDMQPTHGLLVARDGERIVAYAELHISVWDNADVLFVEIEEHPEYRDRGIDDRLLEQALERGRAEGRTNVLGSGWVGSHRLAFWERQGFPVATRDANRRLVLADLDRPPLAQMLADAEAASTDYELVDVPNPAPEELLPSLVAAHSAINDAPLDDLDIEDDAWPAERVRAYEQAMTARRMRMHRLLARRTSDGAAAGHTVVVVEEDRPRIGAQEDTAVIREHRGHRLGLRLKIAMLVLLAEREPQLDYIDTWNAESNTRMIAVNDAIGCVVVARGCEVQKRI